MINIEKRDKIDIITFSVDKINALITDELRDEISRVFENANSKVIIDLKGVKYIDSTGFGCFLSVMRTARNNYGTLKFAGPEPDVLKVFKTLNLHTVFEIYDDVDAVYKVVQLAAAVTDRVEFQPVLSRLIFLPQNLLRFFRKLFPSIVHLLSLSVSIV